MTTTDNFTEAARAEAERRWPRVARRNKTAEEWLDEGMASGFVLGAQWERTHLAAQEPSQEDLDAEVEAVASSILLSTSGRQWENVDEGERREYRRYARAALAAARAVRQEKR